MAKMGALDAKKYIGLKKYTTAGYGHCDLYEVCEHL